MAYIVPFIFITSPALIMAGSAGEVALAIVTSIIGVLSLVGAFEGCLFSFYFNIPARACLGAAALLTIIPGIVTDTFGIGLILISFVITAVHKKTIRKKTGTSD